jgi:putative restriction endonuclease
MRARIAKYRRQNDDHLEDYQIGCRLLEQPFFFDESDWIPIPASWSPNIVTGKTYSTEEVDGMRIWQQIQDQISAPRFGLDEEQVPFIGELEQDRYGEPSLVRPRLGQGTFRVAVIDAYDRKCAVTSEKTLPVLEAAHIRPYSEGGAHEISNGMLLRSDFHTLFDRGYVSTPE